ncbi:MAG: cytochrome c oxidase subunit II [Phycisphaerae bacterium]|nr:cytochrome c oxidase subunit II [Phycisphaerae bacterium]
MLGQSSESSFWLPVNASSYGGEVDWVFYFIYGVCVVMMVLIVVLAVLFIWRYRHRPGVEPSRLSHNTPLELTWTIIPTIVVGFIFYFGFVGFLNMNTPPRNLYEINVTAFKWGWAFQYPNGHVDQNLHIPRDRPVRLILSSQDVIHSLYIPAFRIKKDAVPGRYNKMWFKATKEGEYHLFCAEYCGTKHSEMYAKVIVHDPTQFAAWLEEAANWAAKLPPAEAGQKLYSVRGCAQCHTVDGSGGIGPSFKNIFGESQKLRDGSSVLVDEDYIRNSLMNPGSQIVAGFENVMPTYKGRLKDVEITALIEYIKSLSEHYEAPPAAVEESAPEENATQPAAQHSTGGENTKP